MNQTCVPMTVTEARTCAAKIRAGLEGTRALVLDLYQREGWRALGYRSWRDCVTTEFGQSQSYLYRQLAAAKVDANLSPFGEIPESHARQLAHLPPERQQEVYEQATRGGQKTTANRLAELAAKAFQSLPAEQQSSVIAAEERAALNAEPEEPKRSRAGAGGGASGPARQVGGQDVSGAKRQINGLLRKARSLLNRLPDVADQCEALLDQLIHIIDGAEG